jgi:hypothetical protein
MTGPSATCEKILLIQAEFDGELDAAEAAALQTHRAACRVVPGRRSQLAEARELCRDGLYEPMPERCSVAPFQQPGHADTHASASAKTVSMVVAAIRCRVLQSARLAPRHLHFS